MRWLNGPEPASIHDLTFLRGGKAGKKRDWKRSALYFHIPENVRVVGDSAYEGQSDKVTTTKDAHKPETKKLFARMKSMQETCFKRLKDFRALREAFRHGTGSQDKLDKIQLYMEAAAVLVQQSMAILQVILHKYSFTWRQQLYLCNMTWRMAMDCFKYN